MNTWGQWGAGAPTAAAPFQAASFPTPPVPPVPPAAAAAAPPGFPVGGYPFYGASATMPGAVPGAYPPPQWPMAQGAAAQQQQQWQQWEQWQQQYAQWQAQYGDKYQAMMAMGGMPGAAGMTPAMATAGVPNVAGAPPPLPTVDKALSEISAVGGEDKTNKRAYDTTKTDVAGSSSPSQVAKKAKKEIKESLEEMTEAEKAFDDQFKNWESQFMKWKEQNINHPDKDQYKEYEAKWESWREQLVQRREQMRKKREQKLAEEKAAQIAESTNSYSTAKASSSSSTVAAPNMYPGYASATIQPPAAFSAFNTSQYPTQSTYPAYGTFPGMMAIPPVTTPDLANAMPPDTVLSDKASLSKMNEPPPNFGGAASKGIPGLDLLSGGESLDSKLNTTKGEHTDKGKKPQQIPVNEPLMHSSDDKNPFKFPPPQDTNIHQNQTAPPPGFPPNFQSGPPNNFQTGPPNSFHGHSSFQGSMQGPNNYGPQGFGGPPPYMGQGPPNFPPPNSGNFGNQFGNRPPFNQGSANFPPNTNFQNTDQKNEMRQNFNQTKKMPGLMDGYDPDRVPPNFKPNNYPANQHEQQFNKEDKFKEWEEYYNEENEYENDPFAENNEDYGEYNECSDKFGGPPNKGRQQDRFHGGPYGPGSKNVRGGLENMGPNDRSGPRDFDRYQGGGRSGKFGGPNFDGPQGQGGRFDGPRGQNFDDQAGRNLDGPSGRNFDGPQGRNFDGPPRRNFDGPPGKNFEGPPGRKFDRPPGRSFDGASGRNFDGPPGRNFEGPPGRNAADPSNRTDGPPGRGFDGNRNLDKDRHFDGPPGKGALGGRYGGGPQENFQNEFEDEGFNNESLINYGGPPDDRGPQMGRDRFGRTDTRSGRGRGAVGGRGGRFGNFEDDMNIEGDFDRFGSGRGGKRGGRGGRGGRFEGPGDRGPPFEEQEFDKSVDFDERRGRALDNFGRPGGRPPMDFERSGSGCAPDFDGPPMKGPLLDSPSQGLLPTPDVGRKAPGQVGKDFPPGNFGKNLRSEGIPPFPHELKERATGPPLSDSQSASASVIDYAHKPAPLKANATDLDIPVVLETIHLFDYQHGANPRPSPLSAYGNTPRPRDVDIERDIERELGNDKEKSGSRGRGREREDRYAPRGRDKDRDDKGRGRDDRRDHDRDRRDDRRDDRDRRESDKRADRGRNDRERDRDRDRDRRRDDDKSSDSRYREQSDRRGPRDRIENQKASKDEKQPREESEAASKPHSAMLVEDLLDSPGREKRPVKILVVLRGPPGSGKTFAAKLIKDKEMENGGNAPRIVSLDDYFMCEVEREETDPETKRKITTKVMEYEYEPEMESHYRQSFVKAVRKNLADGYHPFMILDCINNKLEHYEEIVTFAKQKGFQVYVCEMDIDVSMCAKRNVHKRTEKEITEMVSKWEPTPSTQTLLDVRSLLQSAAITEVEMEDAPVEEEQAPVEKKTEEVEKNSGSDVEDTEEEFAVHLKSKWDSDEFAGNKLDRLDGLAKARKHGNSIKDWLQLSDDDLSEYQISRPNQSGKKRVNKQKEEEKKDPEPETKPEPEKPLDKESENVTEVKADDNSNKQPPNSPQNPRGGNFGGGFRGRGNRGNVGGFRGGDGSYRGSRGSYGGNRGSFQQNMNPYNNHFMYGRGGRGYY